MSAPQTDTRDRDRRDATCLERERERIKRKKTHDKFTHRVKRPRCLRHFHHVSPSLSLSLSLSCVCVCLEICRAFSCHACTHTKRGKKKERKRKRKRGFPRSRSGVFSCDGSCGGARVLPFCWCVLVISFLGPFNK